MWREIPISCFVGGHKIRYIYSPAMYIFSVLAIAVDGLACMARVCNPWAFGPEDYFDSALTIVPLLATTGSSTVGASSTLLLVSLLAREREITFSIMMTRGKAERATTGIPEIHRRPLT